MRERPIYNPLDHLKVILHETGIDYSHRLDDVYNRICEIVGFFSSNELRTSVMRAHAHQ